jgi:hypothetical protein
MAFLFCRNVALPAVTCTLLATLMPQKLADSQYADHRFSVAKYNQPA